jgi:hypothetical protein
MVRYKVYPVDSGDTVATTETETGLKNLDINSIVSSSRENDFLTHWSVSSIRSDLHDSISAIEGVRYVEKKTSVVYQLLLMCQISNNHQNLFVERYARTCAWALIQVMLRR